MANRPLAVSERARLHPFIVAAGDAAPCDQRDLMERPFFSLAKTRRVAPILYESGEVHIEVFAVPEHGMATIWDADVLIWAASQIVEAETLGLKTSRFLRFTPYQLLTAIGRQTGARDYRLLKGALRRLQSTSILTTIRQGDHWRRHQFSWINEWEEMTRHDGRAEGLEVVLPDWFYRGVIDRSLVLTIDPDYFRLTGGIERWLYRVARKHAGHQPQGWQFDLPHLHRKSGSLAKLADFACDIRRIALRQPIPGYRLTIERDGRRELLRIRPEELSTESVHNHRDKSRDPVDGIGISGVAGIGTSGVGLSGLQACKPTLTPCHEMKIRAINIESNRESNKKTCCGGNGQTSPERGFAQTAGNQPDEVAADIRGKPQRSRGHKPGGRR